MLRMKNEVIPTVVVILLMSASAMSAQTAAKKPATKSAVSTSAAKSSSAKASGAKSRAEIDSFNEEFKQAILSMDNAKVMALWDDDGTDLLPGMDATTGKANIAKWLDGVTSKMPGWKVVSQDNGFHDIQVNGDWASEWATTVQVAQPPQGKKIVGIVPKKSEPVTAKGKMLLVLKRGSDGKWKIREEAWNSAK
jgi:ketosteroid isomerase-like protein